MSIYGSKRDHRDDGGHRRVLKAALVLVLVVAVRLA